MLKKHLLFVLLLVMVAATASAGTWKIHNYYVAKKIQNVFDTGDRIYYLNSYRLFQFDKTTCQTISLSRQNVLSDDRIRQIYYDWENKLLFVAYYTSNIDVIDADGNVSVNGEILDEPYVEKSFEPTDLTFPYQVPENRYFVLGDHRSASIDSRSSVVGCVTKEQLIGKVVFRVYPFNKFGGL